MSLCGAGAGADFGGASVIWVPAQDSTLEAAWEADAKVTLATGRVSGWGDQKNSHNWAQTDAAKQPVVGANIFGTMPGIRFTAANSEQLTLTGSAIISGLAAVHAFLVLKLAADPTMGTADGLWRFGGGTETVAPFSGDGTIYDNFGSNARKTTGNPTPSMAAARCYEVISTASEWTNRIDGTQISTTGTNTVYWAVAPQRLGSSDTHYLDGWIGGLYICSAKRTGTDLTNWHSYISRKFPGVTFA